MQLCPEIFKLPLEDISNNRLPHSSALFFLKSPPKVELQSGLSLVPLGENGLNVCLWHLWKYNTLLMKDCLFQIDRCSKNVFEALMGSSFIFTKFSAINLKNQQLYPREDTLWLCGRWCRTLHVNQTDCGVRLLLSGATSSLRPPWAERPQRVVRQCQLDVTLLKVISQLATHQVAVGRLP